MSGGVEGEAKVGFLSLPVELIDSFVLPHLEWNDALRFRRVCKWTKEITSGYLKLHPELAPEIQIDEDGQKNLSAFLKLGIPSERIFLNNLSGDEFYKTMGKDGKKFLEQYGPHVKHLRVAQVSRYMYGKERRFLDSLSNLETFEAGHFGYGRKVRLSEVRGVLTKKKKLMVEDPGSDGGTIWFPMIFKKLKNLKISHDWNMVFGRDFLVYEEPLICSTSAWNNLETLMLPVSEDKGFRPESLLGVAIKHFISCISKREPDNQWKMFDFGGFYGDYHSWSCFDSHAFLRLCRVCLENNVKLVNVLASWFEDRRGEDERNPRNRVSLHSPKLGIPVVSMVNIVPYVLPLDLENLERLEIRESSKSSVSVGQDWKENRKEWPALKCLDITINSQRPNVPLFRFLFEDVHREAMEELRLNFTVRKVETFVPCVEDIVAACPNLKKLTIIKWPGGSEDMVKFWKGLEHLEEIHLESCKNLDDSAFLGEDETTPVFMKLTKLRSLTLKGQRMMNMNITDKLFTTVIRQMSLKRLILKSDKPLKSVTVKGVQSLLKGRFADSIEKFPFQDWSLEGVSKKKFRELETEFRSYNML